MVCFVFYIGSKQGRGFSDRLSRMLFGRNGSLVLSAVRFLSFTTISGLVLALTIFYFNVKIDYKHLAIQSDVGELSQYLLMKSLMRPPYILFPRVF